MEIFSLAVGPYATNAYVLYTKGLDAVIIDPGFGSFEAIEKIIKEKSLRPVAIWLTHSHWDHIADVAVLKKTFVLPIYIHKDDVENLRAPGSDGIPIAVPLFEGVDADHFIDENTPLFLGDAKFQAIHTPGHSPGGVCFYCEKENILISGDTIFKGAIGTLSLPTSEPDRMWPSIEKLAKLPPDTKIYPGHGPSTTLQEEQWIHNAKQSMLGE